MFIVAMLVEIEKYTGRFFSIKDVVLLKRYVKHLHFHYADLMGKTCLTKCEQMAPDLQGAFYFQKVKNYLKYENKWKEDWMKSIIYITKCAKSLNPKCFVFRTA
jgi:hypothetical protein